MTFYLQDLIRCICQSLTRIETLTVTPTESVVATTMTEQTGNYTIASGTIQVHIAIPSGAMADIDGVTLTGPISLNLPTLAYGTHDRRYPAIAITAVTGTIIVREDR